VNMLTVHLPYVLRGTKITMDSGDSGFTKPDVNDNRGIQPVAVGPVKILVDRDRQISSRCSGPFSEQILLPPIHQSTLDR